MGTAYTRQSSFSDGDTITAALFNDEYNQLLTSLSYAASGTTGHQHDGTAGEGGNVHSIGDQDFLNKIVADSTNNRWGVFVEVSSSAVEQIRISDGVISPVTDNDVDLGTSSLEFKDLFIDGTAHIDTLDVDVNATVAGTLGVTGALTGSSTIQGTTITATTAFVPDASDGAALGTSALEFSDLFLADGAVINFGADQDVTITHVADTGILLSSTDQLQFGDSGTYIYQSADGVLDLVSDTEIELTATTIDINGAVVMDGAITGGTNITISGELDAATLDISGNADIDGTTNLDAVDIDGAVQIDATVTVGEDDTGYDVKFFGDTASAYMLWDTSADDLILGGAARVVVPASGLVIGSTAVTSTAAELNILDGVTSTAAELNIIDGDTSATNTTLADADRVVVNDAGTMKQVALTDFETYFESSIDTFSTIDINGGSIDGATLGTNSAITQAVIDDIDLNGKVITMTGSASDTAVFTAGTNGTLSIVTTDAAAAAANITITADGTFEADGTTITLDSAGDIILDADGADVIFKDGGTAILTFTNSSSDAVITSGVQDKDIIFKGDDGGSPITALTLDMSDAGAATFNNKIVATELDISGNIDIDGTANLDADVTFADGADIITASAGTSNFRAGVNAGNSIASGGNYNVVVGDEAGTAITTGDNNTAVGYAALDANETGTSNVAIGYAALSATTTSYGTAVGHQALAANTTGANNTAVGYAALTNNDGAGGGGDYNTAIGYGALYTNTEGNTCTGVGYYAGFNNTTGLGNTAIGYYANGAVTDGDYNTGLGSAAGDAVTTGNYNVCVGYGTDVSTGAAANQISIGTNVVCSENSQIAIGSSGSDIRNEFDTDNEWNFSSDVRKKKNIEDAVLGLDFVNDLRPVTYEWKPNYEFPEDFAEYSEENHMTLGVRMHGLVAQEVKVALDKTGVERFSGWKEDPNGSQRISKEAFVIPLIKAVKELSAKNDALEARIAALESA